MQDMQLQCNSVWKAYLLTACRCVFSANVTGPNIASSLETLQDLNGRGRLII